MLGRYSFVGLEKVARGELRPLRNPTTIYDQNKAVAYVGFGSGAPQTLRCAVSSFNIFGARQLIAVLIRLQAAHYALVAIHFHLLTVVKAAEDAWQVHHGRNAEFPRNDSAM